MEYVMLTKPGDTKAAQTPETGKQVAFIISERPPDWNKEGTQKFVDYFKDVLGEIKKK
eukprot:CAMPEP_0169114828 /NCGR_PEP_ID=MMETSP1015-20121227/28985_1 /TAXON_ID=342587 /ORGANISM="Karlodinium micrum, Strain CCMP2283" /LENGTH=57 /DNA_ID=CAMNT_0009177175 /DNA_START=58 /DNA_END=231 /DNA_ORIENTATION=+